MASTADMARGTCTNATLHARPSGRAARAHAKHRWRTGSAHAWPGPLGQRKPDDHEIVVRDCEIMAHDHEIMAQDREIMANDREISGNPTLAIVGDTWTHDDPSIFIRRLSFKENMDCVLGHDSYGFARSDGADHIAKWTARIRRENFPLKIDVLLFFS